MDNEAAPEPDSSAGNYHFDRVGVSIRIADGGPIDAYVKEYWEIEWFGSTLSRDEVADEVERIPASAVTSGEPPLPYAIDIAEKRTEWGASGAVLDVAIFVAEAVGAAATWEAVKWTVRRWCDRSRKVGPDLPYKSLTEYELVERAKWFICERYSIKDDRLVLVSHELRPPNWGTSIFESGDGWTYTCEVVLEDGLVTITRIKRERTA